MEEVVSVVVVAGASVTSGAEVVLSGGREMEVKGRRREGRRREGRVRTGLLLLFRGGGLTVSF